ncbi:MAG: BatD family protein [Rikenellaceae bacterium]
MMSQLFRKIIVTIAALLVVSGVFADVTFKANVPLMVGEGEPFRVEFELNAKPEDGSFEAPNFAGFNLIAGPSVSTGTSIQIVNGEMSKTVNYTTTYVLIAESAGNFTIPAASVTVDKKRYSTESTPIEVVKEQPRRSTSGSSAQQQRQQQQQSEQERATSRVGEDDLFLRMTLSNGSVYKGEPIRATVKLYSRVNIVHNENLKMPTFNGFWAQDITDSRAQTASRETYNGKVYDTHVIREYLLYPQQSGELTIDPTQIDITAQVVVQSRNVDPFFGGGHEFYNVRRHLETSPRTIDVKRLPAGEPASFSGAVGQFSIDMQPIASTTIKANSAATLKVRVSGRGNMTFVQAPKLELPNSFELYNVRTTESIQNEASGAVGYKEFEYPFIARAEGDYTIPAIAFSYFDSTTGAYNEVTTNPFSVTITPDDTATGDAATVQRGSSKMNIEMLGSDIHFIKLGEARFSKRRDPLILSSLYYALLAAIVTLFVLTYVLTRRALKESKNVALKRGKMANKMAVQRFKSAKGYMDSSSEHQFYEEVSRGLWGYMSDKLNIPVSALTKEYVREELSKRGCSSDLVQEFSAIITICDEAQYSQSASSRMNDVYGRALQFVSNIEAFVKRNK